MIKSVLWSQFHIASAFLLVLGLTGVALAEGSTPTSNPRSAFAGCDEGKGIPNHEDPRGRIEARNQVNKITRRTFASFSLDELEENVTGGMEGLCWFRLDGVWREVGAISLDRRFENADIWGSDVPELLALSNGTYTTPGYLDIQTGEDPERTLFITTGLTYTRYIAFTSSDGIPLAEVLKRGGPRKTYQTSARFPHGQQLVVDVTRSGRVRLQIGNKSFIRPKAGISKATMSSQIAANDAFLISYNLENLSASRKGYDIVKQDPFYLLQNPKFEVFARVDPRNYVITEKRTVPLGFSLVQEASQGAIYSKSLVSSESEIQKSIAHSFGAKVKGTVPAGAVPVTVKAGFDASIGMMRSMRQSETVSQAIGYSRAKQYALVVDHPYVTLSDDFLDAVEDARRYDKYDALLEKFGTHYPNAVTYGAAAKMTQSFSEESYTKKAEINGSFRLEAGAKTFGQKGSAYYGIKAGEKTSNTGTIGEEGATFVAVGGNGSWNENGYSAGNTPYPILLDLRPLDELLNPMNFPGEPEIYQDVRQNLKKAINRYIQKNTRELSTANQLPLVSPKKKEPVETWQIYVKHTWCTGKKHWIVKDAVGTLSAEAFLGQRSKRLTVTKDKGLSASCSKKKKTKSYRYKSASPGLLTIRGTRSEIAGFVVAYKMSWRYRPSNKKKFRNHSKSFKQPTVFKKGLAVGKSRDIRWSIGTKGLPDFHLNVRFRRVS
ncbi:MAG: MACPF domain-containing protein [Sneathiellales bacterium]|nr:MACPF domain-containing protein [Sneathiellales bacterium]